MKTLPKGAALKASVAKIEKAAARMPRARRQRFIARKRAEGYPL